jgi:hypothetical protein
MPAGITSSDSMFSVRETPWHGLGAVLDEPPTTIAEAIERSGLEWRVEREPIAIDRGDVATVNDRWLPRCEEIAGWWANVRQDTRQVLGIVGERYRIYLQSCVMSGESGLCCWSVEASGGLGGVVCMIGSELVADLIDCPIVGRASTHQNDDRSQACRSTRGRRADGSELGEGGMGSAVRWIQEED